MDNVKIDINVVMFELKDIPVIKNEIRFFSELSKRINYLTKDKILFCNGVRYFGRKVIEVQGRKLVFHICEGRVNRFDYVEPDGSLQSFKV